MKTQIRLLITLLCAATATLLIGLALLTPANARTTLAGQPTTACQQEGTCFIFEYQGYTTDPNTGQTTITFRVTNKCRNAVGYVAIGTDGFTRLAPANGSVYTGSLGTYNVSWTRASGNPGFVSVKFSATFKTFANGASDVFSIVVTNFNPATTIMVQGKSDSAQETYSFLLSETCHGSQTFSYTGAAQTFTVPNGITQITTTVVGAKSNPFAPEGLGEQVTATLPVGAGETLSVYVGGSVSTNSSAGGFNGGGSGCVGCGGGGASDIREGGAALANRIIVAGGGGGFGATGGFPGGNAGFTTGSAGTDALGFPGSGGGGGTQSAGGSGGTVSIGLNGSDGSLGVGGAAGGNAAGGGGGGYYGGGGGAFAVEQGLGGGGGGGSSFVEGTATNVSHTQATFNECDTSNNGCISISW
jgi:Glycine rich protein